MKSERAIKSEMTKVRQQLKLSDEDATQLVMFGAQQALGWVLNDLKAPSSLCDLVHVTAAAWKEAAK